MPAIASSQPFSLAPLIRTLLSYLSICLLPLEPSAGRRLVDRLLFPPGDVQAGCWRDLTAGTAVIRQ